VSVDTAGRRPPAAGAGAWQVATAVTALTVMAAVTGAATAAALIWLLLTPGPTAAGQPGWLTAYTLAFGLTTLLFAIATRLWAAAVRAVRKHLDLAPRIRAAETLLGAAVSAGFLTMVPVQIVWFGVVRSSALWLGNGLVLLAASFLATPRTLRRARRRARRQLAAAAGGR
jgi:hypothetical protein